MALWMCFNRYFVIVCEYKSQMWIQFMYDPCLTERDTANVTNFLVRWEIKHFLESDGSSNFSRFSKYHFPIISIRWSLIKIKCFPSCFTPFTSPVNPVPWFNDISVICVCIGTVWYFVQLRNFFRRVYYQPRFIDAYKWIGNGTCIFNLVAPLQQPFLWRTLTNPSTTCDQRGLIFLGAE